MKRFLIILFCLLYLSLIVGIILALFVNPNTEKITLYVRCMFGAIFILFVVVNNMPNNENTNRKLEEKIKMLEVKIKMLEVKIEQLLNSSKNE